MRRSTLFFIVSNLLLSLELGCTAKVAGLGGGAAANGGGSGTGGGGGSSGPVDSYAIAWQNPFTLAGYVDASAVATKVIFAVTPTNVTGSTPAPTVECRTDHTATVSAAPYSPCILTGANTVTVTLTNPGSNTDGSFSTDLRITNSTGVQTTQRATYYIHQSLDAQTVCTMPVPATTYFTMGAAVLNTASTFGAIRQLTNPFMKIQMADASVQSFATLRRQAQLNAAGTLLLFTRKYISRNWGSCTPGLTFYGKGGWVNQKGWHSTTWCDAVVANALGSWACIKGGATPVVSFLGSNLKKRIGSSFWATNPAQGTQQPVQHASEAKSYTFSPFTRDPADPNLNSGNPAYLCLPD